MESSQIQSGKYLFDIWIFLLLQILLGQTALKIAHFFKIITNWYHLRTIIGRVSSNAYLLLARTVVFTSEQRPQRDMSGLSSNIILKKARVSKKWPNQDLQVEEKDGSMVALAATVKAVWEESATGLDILKNPRQQRLACVRSSKGTFSTMAGTELPTPCKLPNRRSISMLVSSMARILQTSSRTRSKWSSSHPCTLKSSSLGTSSTRRWLCQSRLSCFWRYRPN